MINQIFTNGKHGWKSPNLHPLQNWLALEFQVVVIIEIQGNCVSPNIHPLKTGWMIPNFYMKNGWKSAFPSIHLKKKGVVEASRSMFITRWWQLKDFLEFSLPNLGEDVEPNLTHIFQVGWFNHQLPSGSSKHSRLENPHFRWIFQPAMLDYWRVD